MAFISVVQGRTCRFDSQTSFAQAEGVYTDDFSDCNIIIIHGKNGDSSRISMTHADKWTKEALIKSELVWVGQNAKILVIARNTTPANETRMAVIPSLLQKCELQYYKPEDCFGVSLNKNFEINLHHRDSIPELIVHPHEWKAHSVYWINLFMKKNGYEEDASSSHSEMMYDSKEWRVLAPKELELGNKAQKIKDFLMKNFKVNKKNSSGTRNIALGNVVGILKQLLKDDTPSEAVNPLSTHFIKILYDGNHKEIFKSDINMHLDVDADKLSNPEKVILAKICNDADNDFDSIKNTMASEFLSENQICSSIRGIYKVCVRIKKHSHIPIEAHSAHASEVAISSSNASSSSSTTNIPRSFVAPQKERIEKGQESSQLTTTRRKSSTS